MLDSFDRDEQLETIYRADSLVQLVKSYHRDSDFDEVYMSGASWCPASQQGHCTSSGSHCQSMGSHCASMASHCVTRSSNCQK